MRLAAVLAISLAAGPASAQYDLATTRDGAALWFSYNVPAELNTKVYFWSAATGVVLFAERPDLYVDPANHVGAHLYGTEITEEGSVVYHAEPFCLIFYGPEFPGCPIGQTGIVIPGSAPFSVTGFLLISPNGRYGVSAPFGKGGLWIDWFTGETIEVDFKLHTIPHVGAPFYVNQHAVANNGSFLIEGAGGVGLRVWSKAGETLLPAPADDASISADGSTVSLTQRNPAALGNVTYVYDMPSGHRAQFPTPVSMSADGQTVAYLSSDYESSPSVPAQAMVAHSDGTGARAVTNLPEGVLSVLLSGDARFLYVVSGRFSNPPTSKMQRYEIATGAVVDIPAVP